MELFGSFKSQIKFSNCTKNLYEGKKLEVFWGQFGINQKRPKISTNTECIEPSIYHLNSIGEHFDLDIKLEQGKLWKKNADQ